MCDEELVENMIEGQTQRSEKTAVDAPRANETEPCPQNLVLRRAKAVEVSKSEGYDVLRVKTSD